MLSEAASAITPKSLEVLEDDAIKTLSKLQNTSPEVLMIDGDVYVDYIAKFTRTNYSLSHRIKTSTNCSALNDHWNDSDSDDASSTSSNSNSSIGNKAELENELVDLVKKAFGNTISADSKVLVNTLMTTLQNFKNKIPEYDSETDHYVQSPASVTFSCEKSKIDEIIFYTNTILICCLFYQSNCFRALDCSILTEYKILNYDLIGHMTTCISNFVLLSLTFQ